MRNRARWWSYVGPGVFGAAAVVSGRLEPGYRARDEPISALAAHGTRSATVMVPGFLGLALSTVALARALRGTALAPDPVPALLTLAGLTVAGAGLARCSDRSCPTRFLGDDGVTRGDDLHAAFSAATFALWIAIPLTAARRSEASPRVRSVSSALGVTTLLALVVGGSMAQQPSARWSGTAQRVMVASALAWYPLAAGVAGRVVRT